MNLAGLAGFVGGKDAPLYAAKEAGKRMADVLNQVVVDNGLAVFGRVMAFRLDDGSSDGVIYDHRADAIRHQLHETLCHYEVLKPRGYSADECALTLIYARAAYDAGWRPSREAPAPIMPVRIEDRHRKTRQLMAARKG